MSLVASAPHVTFGFFQWYSAIPQDNTTITFSSILNASKGIPSSEASGETPLHRQSGGVDFVLSPPQCTAIRSFTVTSHGHIVRYRSVRDDWECGVLIDGYDFAAAARLCLVAVAGKAAIRFLDLHRVDGCTAVAFAIVFQASVFVVIS